MTNILIPTDFSAASFDMAEQAVKCLNREVNIILFHAYEMPFFYMDLYRMDKPPYYNMLNDNFRQGCKQLKERYPHLINKICFQYMQGNTNILFKNFAAANDIHLIVCPATYVYTKTHARSLNPIPFFKKSGIPILQDLTVVKRPAEETIGVHAENALATAW